MCRKEEYLAKAKVVKDEIRAQLNQKSIKYNYHEADVTVLEGILARGDRSGDSFWLPLTMFCLNIP